MEPAITGDWDNGLGAHPDGAYINYANSTPPMYSDGVLWFDRLDEYFPSDGTPFSPYFSAKRMIPSPGTFGSLPTGVQSNIPWRTLLFRPDRQHFGASITPDHLWMDLFRMPTVEPASISSQFADKGKVNLNYQVLPFSYIHRSTALHALLKSERMLAIPTTAGAQYKTAGGPDYRKSIDASQTLIQADSRFEAGEFFRSATEICDLYLVPQGVILGTPDGGDYPNLRAFWQSHQLTGDNAKERVYSTLYSNLTTRSNRFKVHVQAQTITKSDDSAADTFDPVLDTIDDQIATSGFVHRRIRFQRPFDMPDYFSNLDIPRLDEFAEFDLEIIGRPFRITEINHVAADLTVEWLAEIGVEYTIQRSVDLEAWETIGQIVADQMNESYIDDSASLLGGRVFYRIMR